ncbi:MAG: MoaD/ThiS family protein [Planctomycetota bacterium]
MATISFTANIQRHVTCPDESVSGGTVAELLEDYFARHPRARGYVLDDQGALRHHMNIYVDGEALRDRVRQSDAVAPDAELHVFQALSGG